MTNSIPTAVSSFVNANGVTLHVRADGHTVGSSPAAPILYLHSLGADLRIFDQVVARLPQRPHLRLDLRGHGLSGAPAGDYAIAQLADDALRVLDAAGADKAVLVGVSVGGMVALRAALDHPERVAGLVLSNTAAKLGEEDVWRARMDTVFEQGVASLADSTLLRWFPEEFRHANPAMTAGLGNMIARTSAAGYAGVCAALGAEDLRARLPELKRDVLVVGGSHDLSTPPPVVSELARALPAARLEMVDGAGHLPMVDAPERFAALLTQYLEHVNDKENRRG
ncbi:MAG: alpha/beta fold hydrolase [Trueperaceae bacterium]